MKFSTLFLFFLLFESLSAPGLNAQPLSLRDSVTYWANAREFHKALAVSLRWQTKAPKETGTETTEYADVLFQITCFQYELGHLDEALKTAEQVLGLRQRLYKKPVMEVAKAQNIYGLIYKTKNRVDDAKRWYLEAEKTLLAAGEQGHPFYSTVLNNLGTCFLITGQYDEAAAFCNRAMEVHMKVGDKNDLSFLNPKTNLAIIYEKRGNYEKAIEEYNEILSIRAAAGKQNLPNNALVLDWLIRLELLTGKYTKAEAHIHQLLELSKALYGEDGPPFAGGLNLLSDYYSELGNFDKAEQTIRRVLGILEKTNVDSSYQYASALNSMGRIMTSRSLHRQSQACFKKASQIYERIDGKLSDNYLVTVNNLGTENNALGNFYQAEIEFTEALSGFQKMEFKTYEEGNYRTNLAITLRKTGRFRQAEQYAREAMAYFEKLKLAGTSRYHQMALNELALIFLDEGKWNQAEEYFSKLNQQQLSLIQKNFGVFSELEKEKFYAPIAGDFALFNSFCQMRAATHPAIVGQMYNHQLATKALLLNSSAKWKHRIKSSHDRKLLLRFTEWEEYRNRLNRAYQSTDSTERMGIDSLEEKASKLEKELSQRSEHFAELADKRVYTWKDIQAKLKPGEAAIEMVRLSKYGVSRVVTDTSHPAKPVYKETGLTDTVYYAALLVKPGMLHPEMVLLQNGNALEGKYLNQYKNLIGSQALDEKSYAQFWKKIGEKLKGCHRVYFSPDGVYHQINLNTLYNPATKKFLLEEKDICLVTVTKDLLIPRRDESENKLAYLFGHPSYYESNSPVATTSTTDRKSPNLEYMLNMGAQGTLADLPGTKEEVNKVGQMLTGMQWEVQLYSEANAVEENLKECFKPRLLHIATHGYFQQDSTLNPLLRSGLLLAGAGQSVAGKKSANQEDGILTAYEAMNLNLDNTDLVVLSACETGLGEVKNGEGVYGLQRAFKVAGANSIIMSLWKVDDAATQELMVRFYRNWLGAVGAGGQSARTPKTGMAKGADRNSKRSAFLAAQKELKAKYHHPYYWGAFVMVGE